MLLLTKNHEREKNTVVDVSFVDASLACLGELAAVVLLDDRLHHHQQSYYSSFLVAYRNRKMIFFYDV